MFSKYGQVWIILATIGDHVNSEIQTTIDEYEMNGIIASVFSGSVYIILSSITGVGFGRKNISFQAFNL